MNLEYILEDIPERVQKKHFEKFIAKIDKKIMFSIKTELFKKLDESNNGEIRRD